MKIFRKAFVPTRGALATIIVILILLVIFYIISRFLLGTQEKIFPWS